MSKKLILVEWYNYIQDKDYHSTTFELFDNIKKAFDFAESVKVRRIDLVIANNFFYENGKLNYDDKSDTIKKGIISDIY